MKRCKTGTETDEISVSRYLQKKTTANMFPSVQFILHTEASGGNGGTTTYFDQPSLKIWEPKVPL